MVVDELQRLPPLLNYVHKLIEEKKTCFALTGSSARRLKKEKANMLAGRALSRHFFPLTARELGSSFDLRRSLSYGHLPLAITSPDPLHYLESYVGTYLREEVQQEALVRNLASFSRFLESLSLPGTKPLVWRRVLVPGHFMLEALHSIFQWAMGWQMSHLYDFQIGEERYSDPDELGEMPANPLTTTIAAAIGGERQFIYNYDFGDDWRHEVTVEEIGGRNKIMAYPICVGGENACPSENCGGLPGFEELKEKVAAPENPDREETIMWLGGFNDALSFDPNRIDRDMLLTINWKVDPNDQGLYLPYSGMSEAH